MLVDANLLLHAVDRTSPDHDAAAAWLTDALNGDRRVGLAWQTIGAFLRLSTHPSAASDPLDAMGAWSHVADWLAAEPVWIPPATEKTAAVLQRLLVHAPASADHVPEAQLAALAVEHDLTLCSTNPGFARFRDLRWENPLQP